MMKIIKNKNTLFLQKLKTQQNIATFSFILVLFFRNYHGKCLIKLMIPTNAYFISSTRFAVTQHLLAVKSGKC